MELSVNLASITQQALASAREQTTALVKLQTEAATGKRIQVPSDAPSDAVAALAADGQDVRLGAYLDNINGATSQLNAGVSALRDAGDILTTARQLAIEGSSSVNTPQAMDGLATEVDQLIGRLLNTANVQSGDEYLFSGTATRTQPFVVTATDNQGRPVSVAYRGSTDRAVVNIGAGRTIATLYSGSEALQGQGRGTTVFQGPTGAAAGTGTDSAIGQGTLQVRHTATSYAGTSGVAAGTGSAAGDTILGPAGTHQLTIVDTSSNGSAGTVSLDGGPAVPFTSADTNLRVGGPQGQAVFVDATAITAGFNGTVDITATGTLSVDGGATTVPINFSGNQVVTDSRTGAVTNVNCTAIRSTGDDHLDYTGTYDAFSVLMALRDDLRNTAGRSPTDQINAIAGRVSELQRIQDSVLHSVGEQSASLEHLQGLQNNYQDLQLSARSLSTQLQGADITEVAVQLQAEQNQLRLTLAATAQVLGVNLLDFLK
jgi:flagellar hook-associated protein 3